MMGQWCAKSMTSAAIQIGIDKPEDSAAPSFSGKDERTPRQIQHKEDSTDWQNGNCPDVWLSRHRMQSKLPLPWYYPTIRSSNHKTTAPMELRTSRTTLHRCAVRFLWFNCSECMAREAASTLALYAGLAGLTTMISAVWSVTHDQFGDELILWMHPFLR